MHGNEARLKLLQWFQTGLLSISPENLFARAIDNKEDVLFIEKNLVKKKQSVHVLSVGKAALPMARAAFHSLKGFRASGLIITNNSCGLTEVAGVQVLEAGHPIPDQRSKFAGNAVKNFIEMVPEDEILMVLLSGGTSALLSAPLNGLEMDDLVSMTHWLLGSGLDIKDQNTVRKHLSASAGGRFCRVRRRGRTIVLAISDVIGDDFATIGSGPFSADPTSSLDAHRIVVQSSRKDKFPERCLRFLESSINNLEPDLKPGSPIFDFVECHVLARNLNVIESIAQIARDEGNKTFLISNPIQGEAARVGERLAALASSVNRPCVWVLGGETTVTLDGEFGLGGRNQELALAAARYLDGKAEVSVFAAGTDGRDGPTDATGAFVNERTWSGIQSVGRNPEEDLASHNSYHALEAVSSLIKLGSTGTNVMDVAILVSGPIGLN